MQCGTVRAIAHPRPECDVAPAGRPVGRFGAARASRSCYLMPLPPVASCPVAAYDYARRLKTLKGLTPYEAICQAWTKEPSRFTLDSLHQMLGLNL